MAYIQNGKKYTLKNLATGKMLNLYGGITTNGTNVCQYSADNSNEQKWKASGNKLYTNDSTTKCLDRYYSTSSSIHLNADIWTENASENANQYLTFGRKDSYNTISLSDNSYLVASTEPFTDSYINSSGNTTAGKIPGSKGNVYWKYFGEDETLPDEACWIATEIGGTTLTPSNGIIVTNMPQITNYPYPNQQEEFHPGSGMVNGSWYGDNNGTQKEDAIFDFYVATFGVAPPHINNYLYNLYGAKYSDSESIPVQFRNTYHTGIDMFYYAGATIRSALSGTVAFYDSEYGAVGIYDGYRTYVYMHMNLNQSIMVNDAEVSIGTILGTQSDVGVSGSNHLHIEVQPGKATGVSSYVTINDTMPTYNPYTYLTLHLY